MPLEVKQFNCPQCGSPLELKSLRSKSVVCPACNSQIDMTGEAGQVVGRVGSRPRPRLAQFRLGLQGTLNGEPHMVIGRVQYRGDEGDVWEEWLLLSAQGQYVWISDSEEGMALWLPFAPAQPIDPNTIREGQTINLRGTPCRVRDRGVARITYLEGELTWKARVGDAMNYAEADAASERLSLEWTSEEAEFFHGERLNRRAVEQAFGLAAASSASGAKSKGGCLNNALMILIVVVMIVICVLVVSVMPSTGTVRSGGPSIRLGSPGRSFSGGGGSFGGGK